MRPYKLLYLLVLVVWLTPVVSHAQENSPLAPPPDAELPLGELVYEADFLGDPLWEGGDYPNDTFSWEPSRQGLVMVSPALDSPARYAPGAAYIGDNFYVEISFIPVTCLSDESAILLNTRSDPRQQTPTTAGAYVFVVQCDGTFRSRLVEEGGNPGLIDFDGTLETPLQPKEKYHLGVMLQGRMATWYWNGTLLGNYFISQRPVPGETAPGAQLGMEVVVTSLRIWELTD